jgi:hypothetical protein
VSTVSSPEVQNVARRLAGDRFDEYAARGLARAYEEFTGRRRRAVGTVSLEVDGRPYPHLYAVLADPEAKFAEGAVRLAAPGGEAEWEFLAPFESILFHSDGSAELKAPGNAPARRAIARVLLREHYLVRSKAEDAPGTTPPAMPGLVGTLEQGIAICRSIPVLPFEVALLLYLGEERVRYEVDAVHSELLRDPRSARLAAGRRVHRTSRIAWGLDRKIGRGHLSLLAARCLEVLVESNGLTSIDLAHIFGGVRELVDSALRALVDQRYATFDPRTGVYRARLEAFLPPTAGERTPPAAPVRPGLRTSVQELLAAADARATCPLCGRPLAAGASRILCDDCSRKVGLG